MVLVNLCPKLDQLKIKFIVGSNNSSKTSQGHSKLLTKVFNKSKDIQVVTSLDVAIHGLKKMNYKSLYWVANKEVDTYLSSHFEFNNINPDALLLTYDTEIGL